VLDYKSLCVEIMICVHRQILTGYMLLAQPAEGKTTESDCHPNPNPNPFCMEWKQISVLLAVVRYSSLPQLKTNANTGVCRRDGL